MRRVGEVISLVVVLAANAASLAQQVTDARTWEMPFRLVNEYAIVVKGSIGGIENCNFIIDTGTNPSVIDERTVRKLRVPMFKSRMSVLAGEIHSFHAVLPSITLGPIVATNLRAAVEDLSSVSSELGMRIDGLIGLDVLAASNLRISYERHMLVFGDSAMNAANMVSFEVTPPFVVLAMEVEGRPFRVILDTGCFAMVLFGGEFERRLPRLTTFSESLVTTIQGEVDLQRVGIQDVVLGNSRVNTNHAYLAKTRKVPNVDGLLGAAGLGAREISLDFAHKQFAWQ